MDEEKIKRMLIEEEPVYSEWDKLMMKYFNEVLWENAIY